MVLEVPRDNMIEEANRTIGETGRGSCIGRGVVQGSAKEGREKAVATVREQGGGRVKNVLEGSVVVVKIVP